MNHIRSIVPALTVMALLTACGEGTPTDGGEDTRVIKSTPLFATDIQEIFTRRGCATSACHGSSMQGGLGLASNAESFGDLVGVASLGNPNVLLVAPNDAVNSYLVQKLEGTAGTRMPIGGTLDNIDLTNIKNWINTGAPDN